MTDTSLKLTCYLARSPLPVAALPSMSLIPQLHSRIHTNDPSLMQFLTIRAIRVLVVIVACAISYDFSVLAADEEPVAESPSQESPSATGKAEEKPEVLYTSPSGAFQSEQTGVGFSGGEGESTGDIWVVSTKDPTQPAKLPKQASDSPLDDGFDFSPNEEWIFSERHIGSG